MSKQTKLLFEGWRAFLNEQDLSKDPESIELSKKLFAAFKAGPAQTKAFLNSAEGQSEKLHNILKSGLTVDKTDSDDVVQISGPADTSVSGKIPTQNFIDLMQSVAFPLGSAKSFISLLNAKKGFGTIVTDGNLIIDGHHRWSGVFAFFPDDGQINAINVSWPGKDTKEKLAAAQLSIAAWGGAGKKQPEAGGEVATNILGKGAEQIAQMIMANINKQVDSKAPGALLNDQMMQEILQNKDSAAKVVFSWAGMQAATDVNQIRQAIAKKVGENLSKIKSNPQAPARPEMPQFDPKRGGPELTDVIPDLKAGKLNITPPFVKESLIKKIVQEELRKLKRR